MEFQIYMFLEIKHKKSVARQQTISYVAEHKMHKTTVNTRNIYKFLTLNVL